MVLLWFIRCMAVLTLVSMFTSPVLTYVTHLCEKNTGIITAGFQTGLDQ